MLADIFRATPNTALPHVYPLLWFPCAFLTPNRCILPLPSLPAGGRLSLVSKVTKGKWCFRRGRQGVFSARLICLFDCMPEATPRFSIIVPGRAKVAELSGGNRGISSNQSINQFWYHGRMSSSAFVSEVSSGSGSDSDSASDSDSIPWSGPYFPVQIHRRFQRLPIPKLNDTRSHCILDAIPVSVSPKAPTALGNP